MCYIFLLFHANADTFLKVQSVSALMLKEFFIICLALIEKKLFISIVNRLAYGSSTHYFLFYYDVKTSLVLC